MASGKQIKEERCGARFAPKDAEDAPAFTCDREKGFHIVHRESSTGTEAVRAPKGAFMRRRQP